MFPTDPKPFNSRYFIRSETPRIPRWKRALDLACCAMALPLLCVLSVVMTVVLRFASPGPVFFMQRRVGFKGSRFMCYKFRTMVVGADTTGHQAHLSTLLSSNTPMVKLDSKGDKRMIPGAWILRATGLDELPQIINVLKGEMTIVGPRPCLPYEANKYKTWQRQRFNAMPGLTGLWQVSGKNRTTFDEMIRLDIQYSERSCLGLDLKIILMTLPALLGQIVDTRRARRMPLAVPAMPAVAPAAKAEVERNLQAASSRI